VKVGGGALQAAAVLAAQRALEEDLAGYGDVTGRAFSGRGSGRIVARQPGVLSGSVPLAAAAALIDPDVAVEMLCGDGDHFADGDSIAVLRGELASLFALERTGLNFLARLSGVATLTAAYVAETSGTQARIAATRKTTPGLRLLEKTAVVHGGGTPHRCGLFDGAMIKDNHIAAAGSVAAAIQRVRTQLPHTLTLEVEVDTLAQLAAALAAGVGLILLDNMDLATVQAAVAETAGRAILEVSGGVQLNQVRSYAAVGVDIMSVGALTTRAPWIDVSFELD
jgi:nicotinate-nucleotide pyrophosphorylase (carboxylating)